MGIEDRLNQIIEKDGAVHLTLLDPDSQRPEVAGFKQKKPSLAALMR